MSAAAKPIPFLEEDPDRAFGVCAECGWSGYWEELAEAQISDCVYLHCCPACGSTEIAEHCN